MSTIFVAGLLNVETTLRVDTFPVPYFPVCYPFFGINTAVSGVGYNIATALNRLSNTVHLASLIGQDSTGQLVRDGLTAQGLSPRFVHATLRQSPQSVILYDGDGRRQIHTDLKDIQDQSYPQDDVAAILAGCDIAALCNINFARPLLSLVQARGIPIATDVHALADLDDAYNRDFMGAADILFMSHERLPCAPLEWAQQMVERYRPTILVIGLGGHGALLSVPGDAFVGVLPALTVRPIVNTIGAGDALFSAFLHCYGQSRNPYDALKRAVVFAAYKIGETGGAQGFLDRIELERLYHEYQPHLQYREP